MGMNSVWEMEPKEYISYVIYEVAYSLLKKQCMKRL